MTNRSTIQSDQWNSTLLLYNNIIFTICILAIISHCSIWFQLFVHKTKFDLSFVFSLGYIVGDLFLLPSYLIDYSVRLRVQSSVTPLFCYFQAYSIFIFNLLQSYDLALLNICRYRQIVRNQNIYQDHRQKLLCISLIVLLFILANLFVQHKFSWSIVVVVNSGTSCSLSYTNNLVKIWNFLVTLSLPIAISFSMLIQALYFLQNFHAQQVIIHRNHHRQLIIHSLIFYSGWFVLWGPFMMLTFLDIDGLSVSIAFAAFVASTVEVFVDPFLIFFLDKRFARAWEKSFRWAKQQLIGQRNVQIHPVTFQPGVQTIHTPNEAHQ